MVLLLSGKSRRGHWVERELELILEQTTTVIPVLLDEHAKDNWVWPLVSDRNALTLKDTSDAESIANDIYRWVGRERNPQVGSSQAASAKQGGSEMSPGVGDDHGSQVRMETPGVEVIIQCDFDTFSEEKQEKIMSAIKSLMTIGDIRVVRKRKG